MDIGNATQNWKNLLTLAIAEANTGGAGAWARWSRGYGNSTTFGTGGPQPVQALQVYPSLVPGFVPPIGTGGTAVPAGLTLTLTAGHNSGNHIFGWSAGGQSSFPFFGQGAIGSVSPSSPMLYGELLTAIAYDNLNDLLYVAAAGAQSQTLFTSMSFSSNTYLTSAATFEVTSDGESFWTWSLGSSPITSGDVYALTFS